MTLLKTAIQVLGFFLLWHASLAWGDGAIEVLAIQPAEHSNRQPKLIDVPHGPFLQTYGTCGHQLIFAGALSLKEHGRVQLPSTHGEYDPTGHAPTAKGFKLLLAANHYTAPIHSAEVPQARSTKGTDLSKGNWKYSSSFNMGKNFYTLFQSLPTSENFETFLLLVTHREGEDDTGAVIPVEGKVWGKHAIVWNNGRPYALFAKDDAYLLMDFMFRSANVEIAFPPHLAFRPRGLPMLAQIKGRTVAGTISVFSQPHVGDDVTILLQDIFAPAESRNQPEITFKLPSARFGTVHPYLTTTTHPRIDTAGATLFEKGDDTFILYPYEWEETIETPIGLQTAAVKQLILLNTKTTNEQHMLPIGSYMHPNHFNPAIYMNLRDRDLASRPQIIEGKNGNKFIFVLRVTGEAFLFRVSPAPELVSYLALAGGMKPELAPLRPGEAYSTQPLIINRVVDGKAQIYFSGITYNEYVSSNVRRYVGRINLPE